MRISDWSSDVCSSDLPLVCGAELLPQAARMASRKTLPVWRIVLIIFPVVDQRLALSSPQGLARHHKAQFARVVYSDATGRAARGARTLRFGSSHSRRLQQEP